MATFGENLRALRLSRGYSQQKFAEVIGSNQACITAWERNARVPSLSMIRYIADAFKVPLSTLLPLDDTGIEQDTDRGLLDLLQSKPMLLELMDRARFLSDQDLGVLLGVARSLSKDVYHK